MHLTIHGCPLVLHFTIEIIPFKGLKLLGERGKAAVRKEVKSSMDFDVLEALLASELTREEREGSLPLMMTLKEKKSSEIKARGVAGGHKERGKISVGDVTSSTVITESLYMTCVTYTCKLGTESTSSCSLFKIDE